MVPLSSLAGEVGKLKMSHDDFHVEEAVMLRTRFSVAPQYLSASTLFARKAWEIEQAVKEPLIDDARRTEHMGYVTAAIMQSEGAFEAEIAEVTRYGPCHHLGSPGDRSAEDTLFPKHDEIDKKEPLEKYDAVLHLLSKRPMDKGRAPYQDALLLVKLRNYLIHYKSAWHDEQEGDNMLRGLRSKRHQPPRFIYPNQDFFPYQCLSAHCASWAVVTAASFITMFFDRLEVPSPIGHLAADLADLREMVRPNNLT